MARDANAGKRLQRLLAPMSDTTISALIEFAEYVAHLDVDYIIIMARKAVRLHDLLIAGGCRIPKAEVITDHVLDQNLELLKGKRVAVVDDTLILGTTLAAAARRLREHGVHDLRMVVFAVDRDNWCKELANPEKYFANFNSAEMLSFCAQEVEAFSLAGIPYLTDFPVSATVRLRRSQLSLAHSLPGWDSFALTNPRQQERETYIYSHLPTENYLSDIAETVGTISDIIEIAKVRSFVVRKPQHFLMRVIPIVTLQSLSDTRVPQLFSALIGEMPGLSPGSIERITRHVGSPGAQLRFMQYYLSCIVGYRYLQEVCEAAAISRSPAWDLSEATRLFGPWLRADIQRIHEAAERTARGLDQPHVPKALIEADRIPPDVARLAQDDYVDFFGEGEVATPDRDLRDRYSDLVRIFVEMHKKHEIPARQEARNLGAGIFSATREQAPHRDRLSIGLTWSAIADFLLRREGIGQRHGRSMLLSLMLDAVVDLGIAVPILAYRSGILFRAYRHGENAIFGHQEYALAYSLAEGFLHSNGRASIPKLTMEKLLVSLMRVGVAKRFLIPELGLGGAEQMAHVAFHHHGAVTVVAETATAFADSQDSYLSMHLVKEGVFKRVAGGQYILGDRPEAGLITPSAGVEARQVGWLLGKLTRSPGNPDRTLVLDENGLIVLTSCCTVKDAAGAVAAEFREFGQWAGAHLRPLANLDLKSTSARQAAWLTLTRSSGYFALNSAALKVHGYLQGEPEKLVQRAADHFVNEENGDFIAQVWLDMWQRVFASVTEEQKRSFSVWMEVFPRQLVELALAVFTIELALLSPEADTSSARYAKACEKVGRFLGRFEGLVELDEPERTAQAELLENARAIKPLHDIDKAIAFALGLIETRLTAVKSAAAEVGELLRNSGRLSARTDYYQAVWYDIIDSTGQKSGLTGVELVAHRNAVRNFKRSANRLLHGLKRDALRFNADLALHPSSLSSTDDEKNIFFAGARGIERMKDAVALLLSSAKSAGINLRVLVINGDFAGVAPHSYEGDPNIEGSDFWEYGSRVKKFIRQLEDSKEQERIGSSLLWLAGSFTKAPEHFAQFVWSLPEGSEAEIEIEQRVVKVDVYGGELA